MATSNVYTYSTNRDQVCLAAGRKINIFGDFETPADTDPRMVALITALNPLIKQMMAYGMPVWKLASLIIPFSTFTIPPVGTAPTPVTIGSTGGQVVTQVAPLKVFQGLRRDNLSGIDVPLNIYTFEDYNILANKEAVGAPVHVFYQPLRNSGQVIVWPLPDTTYWQVNGSLYLRYQIPVQDFTAATDEPDFPIEWNKVLIYGLAYDVADEYGVDAQKQQEIGQKFKENLETVLGFGTEEGGFFVQPRMR
jgi:hypothetical protein